MGCLVTKLVFYFETYQSVNTRVSSFQGIGIETFTSGPSNRQGQCLCDLHVIITFLGQQLSKAEEKCGRETIIKSFFIHVVMRGVHVCTSQQHWLVT